MEKLYFFYTFFTFFDIIRLPLLALGYVYVGRGITIRFGGSWISFLDLLFFSWLID